MSSKAEFNVGDTVQIGSNGEKGKIIDIVRPLGIYCMYKVHTFYSGEIKEAAKHELVKGLPDDHFKNLFNCFSPEDIYFDAEFDDIFLQQELLSLNPQTTNAKQEMSAVPLYSNLNNKSDITMKSSECKRFATVDYTPDEYRQMQKNKNTENKTKSHLRLIGEFLATKHEVRLIHMIPPEELNRFLQEFVVCVRQKDGSEYEPSTLRGMISSLDRYLAEKDYGTSVARGKEFALTMATLQSKGKDLKKQGKGNKRRAAHDISDEEVDLLYAAGELGNNNPSSLINTLWFNNTLHFGIRGGAMEHRQLKWGDITLGYDSAVKCEFLEYAERQTKTRTGEDINNHRKQNPRLYSTGNERCPVETYKIYANHRPSKFSGDDHPFYLAVVTHKKFPQDDEQWFLSAPIGVNKLKDLMKIMAKNAKLPEVMNGKRLTNTSVRKRLCQKLLQNNVPDTQAVLITGHKNPSSLNNYRVLSNKKQKQISDILSSASGQTSVVECQNHLSQNVSNNQTSFVAQNVPSMSLFANATITGGTFNITIQNPGKM